MWSIRPTPCRPAIWFSSSISSTPSSSRPLRPTGRPRSKVISTSSGSSGAQRGVDRPLEGLGRRLDPGVFEDARLDRAAPEVLVGAEDRLLGRLDLDAVLGGELQLLGPGPLPLAHRRDDLQLGGERLERDVEADLVVPLARAAVRDGDRAVVARRRGPSTARSGGGPARSPGDTSPRRAPRPSATGTAKKSTNRLRASSAIASTAPVRSAFSRIAWMSCPWPRSQV